MSDKPKTDEPKGQEIQKRKRGRPPKPKDDQLIKKGDNSKFLVHSLKFISGSKIDVRDPVQLEQRTKEFFAICIEDDIKPSYVGYCNAIGVERRKVLEYRCGIVKIPAECVKIINDALNVIEDLWETYMTHGKINPASGIFIAKNNFGYSNNQEVKVIQDVNPNEGKTPEEIKEKYMESVIVDAGSKK